ncbi:ABC transporter permease [Curtobacterium sp. ISL-83]|uniref:ABC transporter permease n=1 Tax=Curtobacterium sp. ISL-83 TaxID=2819145 RepID=UPI001BEC0781|nr:ABC transporter permease [Curtobacterium sp. ISL-83]MBT2501213.1 ABC transporter permease [Curtobacterium sp. ISL-83]
MRAAVRSLLVNRSALVGASVVIALAAALLAVTAAWLEAGLRDPQASSLIAVGGSFAGTLVSITVFMVATTFTAVLRERRREFALLRAVGATARQVRVMVTTEVLVLVAVIAPAAAVAGTFAAPFVTPLLRSSGIVPAGVGLTPSVIPIVCTLAVLLPTGLLAARAAARASARSSTAAAVRESAVDEPVLSRVRTVLAVTTAALGLMAAATPFAVPGGVGSATGASSAILLVVAAALAGPLLVQRAARSALAARHGAIGMLALTSARGFPRRLSAVVIPLALLVALGSVQTGTAVAVEHGTEQQLRSGVRADLVVTSASGVTHEQVSAVEALPGVTATTSTGSTQVSVRTDSDDQDLPALDALSWESVSIRTLSAVHPLVDPAVVAGSLRGLHAPRTIAVSSDTVALAGKGVGDSVEVRRDGGAIEAERIVAVFDRGLGFGDYLTQARPTERTDALFVEATGSDRARIRAAVESMGLRATDPDGFVRRSVEAGDGERQLSWVLLAALLVLVGAVAANTLVTSVRGRRDEFALLRRTGATRGQLMRAALVETGFIAVVSIVIGTVAVLPALAGISQGLVGVPWAGFDLAAWSGCAAAVVAIAAVAVLPTAWRTARSR